MKTLLQRICGVSVIILLSACGPDPYPYGYSADCLTLESAVQLDQFKMKLLVAKAKSIVDSRWGSSAFCNAHSKTHVSVRSVPWWNDPVLGEIAGFASPFGIELSNDGSSLVHETYHAIEIQSGNMDSGNHPHWKEWGYYRDDIQFAQWVFYSLDTWLTP